MDRAERLTHNFDIDPGPGVEKNPLPQQAEDEVVETVEDEATDEALEESAEESQVEETEVKEDEDEQTGEVDIDMGVGQFANASGVTLKEFYHGIKMPDGRTLSQAVDETGEQRAALQRLQTERNQLQEQLQTAQSAAVQVDSPEVVELEAYANLLQKALDEGDFSQMDQGQAANYRLNQMNLIQQYRQAANVKRGEFQVKQQEQMGNALMEANKVLLGQIPEWASEQVAMRENQAMGAYLINRGFTADDLRVIDRTPKVKLLVRDAWKAEAKQAEIKKGAQKVRKISKTLKPGAMKGTAKAGLREVAKQVKQAGTRAEKQRARLSMQFDR